MNRKQKLEMYPYACIYRGKKTLLIWQTNDIDTFKKTSDTCLLQSHTLSSMKKKLRTDTAKVHWSEYSEMNFDKFWTALKNLRTERASSIVKNGVKSLFLTIRGSPKKQLFKHICQVAKSRGRIWENMGSDLIIEFSKMTPQ